MMSSDSKFLGDNVVTKGPDERPSEAVALIGYLGPLKPPGEVPNKYRRLYTDVSLQEWYEIADKDIIAHTSLAENGQPSNGPTLVWVERTANVVVSTSRPASTLASASRPAAGLAANQAPLMEDLGEYRRPR